MLRLPKGRRRLERNMNTSADATPAERSNFRRGVMSTGLARLPAQENWI